MHHFSIQHIRIYSLKIFFNIFSPSNLNMSYMINLNQMKYYQVISIVDQQFVHYLSGRITKTKPNNKQKCLKYTFVECMHYFHRNSIIRQK
jgi:hypothetical protein